VEIGLEWPIKRRESLQKILSQYFQYLTLHNIGGLQFVIPRPSEKGILKMVSGPKDTKKLDVVVFDITTDNEYKKSRINRGTIQYAGS